MIVMIRPSVNFASLQLDVEAVKPSVGSVRLRIHGPSKESAEIILTPAMVDYLTDTLKMVACHGAAVLISEGSGRDG